MFAEKKPVFLEKKSIALSAAKAVADAIEQFATSHGWVVAMAIVDDAGHLVHFSKMDGTQTGSVEIAMRKAVCAARFRRATSFFEEAVTAGRNSLLTLDVVALAGGLPIWAATDQLIGAVGVSGRSAQEDAQAAQVGVDALAKLIDS